MTMAFGDFLAQRMAERRVKRKDLAERLGVGHNTISGWITGKHLPENKHIPGLAEVLNVSKLELVKSLVNIQETEPEKPAETPVEKRKKGIYVGAPACFSLELALQHVSAAFGRFNCYLVGSSLERQDWRDIDIRFIMDDEDFAKEFPNAGQHWESDPKWLILTVAISEWLSRQTGLPVDFQFQPQTHANKVHSGLRSAIGLRITKDA